MYKDKFGNIIGVGEDTTYKIATLLMPSKYHVGRQALLSVLIGSDNANFLDVEYRKHKIDIVIYDREISNFVGVIRIQGKDHTSGKKGISHQQKSLKDKNLKKIFKDNNLWICDILFTECPNIFKEQLNWDSVIEFCNMMKMAGVKLRN